MKKICFSQYDYHKEECLECKDRISCMMKKFEKPLRKENEWSDDSTEPNCFGSFKGTVDCEECPFRENCNRTSKEIRSQSFRRGKKIRLEGKYKGRGRYKPRNLY